MENTSVTTTSVAGTSNNEKRKRGLFPRVELSKAIELVTAIYELGEGEPVRRLSAFDKLEKKPDSGPSRMLVTSANGYGLVSGGYQAEFFTLTEKGLAIASANDPNRKMAAIYDILFENDLFNAFIQKFSQKSFPNDQIAIDYLKLNHKLSEEDATSAVEVFKNNINTFRLTREFSGRNVIISKEMALESLGSFSLEEVSLPATGGNLPVNNTPQVAQPLGKIIPSLHPIQPQIHFNIQVVIPENGTPEQYDAIFKSIATHLIGRDNA